MKKGLILVVVMGVALVIFTLILVALTLMTNESRIAEHKIRRMRAFYAAQAGTVLAQEQLRIGLAAGGWDYNRTYCINGPVAGGAPCTETIMDNDCADNNPCIPYNVEIRIGGEDAAANGSTEIRVRVGYGG
jgi:Tfp pilus assembly protein PilX|tara:strand:+ start:770 stop:1165 length:396 start_codon:yes stop_codon:yes gene_type:complete